MSTDAKTSARSAVEAAAAAVDQTKPPAARPAEPPPARVAAARSGPAMSDRVRETLERFRSGDMEIDDTGDRFHISADKIPDGTTYEWKRVRVYGKEDVTYESTLERGGWTPVEATRHPEMMPRGHKGHIEREGMILMERPKEITDTIRRRDRLIARQLVDMKEDEALSQTPDGTLSRTEPALAKVRHGFRKEFAPINAEIPD